MSTKIGRPIGSHTLPYYRRISPSHAKVLDAMLDKLRQDDKNKAAALNEFRAHEVSDEAREAGYPIKAGWLVVSSGADSEIATVRADWVKVILQCLNSQQGSVQSSHEQKSL